MTLELLLLGGFALLAGFVDAIAGGGGLVQVPALLAVFPQTPLATLFGTNKFASIWGTASAAAQYVRRVRLPWRTLVAAIGCALAGSFLGARAVSLLPAALARPAVLVLLVLVAWYTFRRPHGGTIHAPRLTARREAGAAAIAGAGLGFYDGLFGPSTGAFLIFVFVRVLGYDFLHASAAAKLVNVATNLAALAYFAHGGQVLWKVALIMAACNVLGALAGSRLALRLGSVFVRRVFLVVVVALIAKLALDTVEAWL